MDKRIDLPIYQKSNKLLEDLKAWVLPFVFNGHNVTGRRSYLVEKFIEMRYNKIYKVLIKSYDKML